MNSSLIANIKAAIKQYNYYRSPEAVAKLITVTDNIIKVEFTGTSFCFSCGLYDWFDDLRYELIDFIKKKIEITKVTISENEEKFIVEFEIKD
ncbi:MAG: hypothetical protein NDF54_09955 [archaeon GB-1867-035]|nr:hypothetical protein [Candidatus Culexmicrobium profundum]